MIAFLKFQIVQILNQQYLTSVFVQYFIGISTVYSLYCYNIQSYISVHAFSHQYVLNNLCLIVITFLLHPFVYCQLFTV